MDNQESKQEDKKETDALNEQNTSSAEEDQFKQQLEKLTNEKLRVMADFDNYRKKTETRLAEREQAAKRDILLSLVDLIDDFERMIADLDDKDADDDVDAFKPVLDKARGILVDHGIERLNINVGDKFSPKTMEAIGTAEADEEVSANQIKYVAQPGYRYTKSGQVLRSAKVLVAK